MSIGYRGDVEPLLPFGHGLGYTSWEYLAMDGARVRLANTGTRPGREVVQVYASRPDSAIERPPRWLVGFAVVEAAAGEEVIVDVSLYPRAFEHWDGGWQTEPGAFTLEAGRSVADLRLRRGHATRWSCASSNTSPRSRGTATSRGRRSRSTSPSPRSRSRSAGSRPSSG